MITEFEHKFCSTCGHKIHVKAEICPKCGVRVGPPPGALNKVALLLITFCFGGLGAHKFYQKKYLLGVLYLLFFWTYIPTLVAWVEFIIYACKSEAELQQRYPDVGGAGVVLAIIIPFIMVAIIGILAAIAIPQFAAYRKKASNSAAISDLKCCKTEAESYFSDHQTYPTEAGQMQCGAATGVALYYVSLGAEEYQLISFHNRGKKAFVNHSSDTEILEYAKEEISEQIEENYGPTALGSTFHFIE
jgi:TM2 domain-containing membrane protein YozV